MQDGIPAGSAILSPEELVRMQAFRFHEHRREYATTRLLVRTALSSRRQTASADWRFRANPYGKPELDPACGLEFNLSNSPGLVVCLLAEGAAVGVDAEPYGRAEQILKLAGEVFSAAEQLQLSNLETADRLERALSLWTLKEAYAKALGLGLSLPLQSFSFLFDGPGDLQLVPAPNHQDRARRWRFCLLDHAGHRVALAVACETAPQLELWELRPTQGKPRLLPHVPALWFPAG